MKPVIIWNVGTLRITAGLGWIAFYDGSTLLGRIRGQQGVNKVAWQFANVSSRGHGLGHPVCHGLEITCNHGTYLEARGKKFPLDEDVRSDIAWWCRNQTGSNPVLTRAEGCDDQYFLEIRAHRYPPLRLSGEELARLAATAAKAAEHETAAPLRLDADHAELTLTPATGAGYQLGLELGPPSACSRGRLARAALDAHRLAAEDLENAG